MGLVNKIAKAGMGIIPILAPVVVNAQALHIYTSLPNDLVRGETYQVDVKLDSTEFPNAEISSANWRVYIPGIFTPVDPIAQLPYSNNPSDSPNDFYYTFLMDSPPFEEVSTILIPKYGGYQLEGNSRSLANPIHAPSNRVGDLENIFVRVNDDVPVGYREAVNNVVNSGFSRPDNFGLYGAFIYDTNGSEYTKGNGSLTIFNPGFNIHAFHGDTDDDGDVDLTDLGILAGNYEINEGATWSMGNFDNDGDVDLTDLGILAGNYGSGVQQAMIDFQRIRDIPEPSGLVLLVGGMAGALAKRRGREEREYSERERKGK